MIHRHNIAAAVEKRLQTLTPATYDETARTVDAILSRGSPVQRFYGTEKLEISRKAVDLSRMKTSGISVLDSHQMTSITASLGKLSRVWIETDSIGPALMGTIRFHATEEGRKAEGMVARGEITGVSAGYSVDASDWAITDRDGRDVDPNSQRWGESDLTFTATKWTLAECSLVSVGADPAAGVRSATVLRSDRAYQMLSQEHRSVITRMKVRASMTTRSGSTLYIDPDWMPRASIFDVQQKTAGYRYWDRRRAIWLSDAEVQNIQERTPHLLQR